MQSFSKHLHEVIVHILTATSWKLGKVLFRKSIFSSLRLVMELSLSLVNQKVVFLDSKVEDHRQLIAF